MRTVRQEREVSRDLDEAANRYKRAEMAYMALEWTLAHNPNLGEHRSGRYWLYAQPGKRDFEIPDLTVLYSFTDDEITLHAVVVRTSPV